MSQILGHGIKSDRSKTSQAKKCWLTAEELGEQIHRNSDNVRSMLYEIGLGCKEAKKPKEEAVRKNMVRIYQHHGKEIYKWNAKVIIPLLREHMKNQQASKG